MLDAAESLPDSIALPIREIPYYNSNFSIITITLLADPKSEYKLAFPAFMKAQLVAILALHTPTEPDMILDGEYTMTTEKLWRSFVSLIHASVAPFTNNIHEILRLAELMWPQYIEPIKENTRKYPVTSTINNTKITSAINTSLLFGKIKPLMTSHTHRIFTREVTESEWDVAAVDKEDLIHRLNRGNA